MLNTRLSVAMCRVSTCGVTCGATGGVTGGVVASDPGSENQPSDHFARILSVSLARFRIITRNNRSSSNLNAARSDLGTPSQRRAEQLTLDLSRHSGRSASKIEHACPRFEYKHLARREEPVR